jgi:hypothetical protein
MNSPMDLLERPDVVCGGLPPLSVAQAVILLKSGGEPPHSTCYSNEG